MGDSVERAARLSRVTTFTVTDASAGKDPWLHCVRVSHADSGRTVIIRASYEWIDAAVPELDVQAVLSTISTMTTIGHTKKPCCGACASRCAHIFGVKVVLNIDGDSSAGARSRRC